MGIRFLILLCLFSGGFLSGCVLDNGAGAGSNSSSVQLQVPPHKSVLALAPAKAPASKHLADYIIIQKKDRILSVWNKGRLVQTFPIMALGEKPSGHKFFEGDERTPEGLYYIDEMHVSDNFQKFLRISYPNARDRESAARFGLKPGGQVGIHGDRGGFKGFVQRFDKNWTDGCIALRNTDIEKLYAVIDVGTPILIKP